MEFGDSRFQRLGPGLGLLAPGILLIYVVGHYFLTGGSDLNPLYLASGALLGAIFSLTSFYVLFFWPLQRVRLLPGELVVEKNFSLWGGWLEWRRYPASEVRILFMLAIPALFSAHAIYCVLPEENEEEMILLYRSGSTLKAEGMVRKIEAFWNIEIGWENER